MRHRVVGGALVTVGTLWILVVGVAFFTSDETMLAHPYRRYETTVILVEYRGSGCGRAAEIWIGRELDGTSIEVCDQRAFGRAELGDVLEVGEPTILSRLVPGFVVTGILSFPGWLFLASGYSKLVGLRGNTGTGPHPRPNSAR